MTSVGMQVADWLVPVTSFHTYDDDWLRCMTSAGTRVADWLVPVGAPVKLTVDCPRGWPIILTVDMGDGQTPQRIVRPADYDPATDDHVARRRSQAATTPAVPTTTTQATPGRRRRDVDPSLFGQPFVLPYQYRTPGSYKYIHQLIYLLVDVNSLSNCTFRCPLIELNSIAT